MAVYLAVLAITGAQHYQHQQQEEHSAPAHYSFSYSVHDEHTGDIKSQSETRDGDVVHGHYELIDSDGHKRIVEYTADKHNGFNAVVHREPTDIKIPIPAPKAHHYSAPAPAVHHYSAPAPAVHHYSAPAPAIHHFTAPASAPAKVSQYISSPVTHQYSSGHISQPSLKITKPIVPVHEYVATAPAIKYSAAPVAKISSAPVTSFGSYGKSSQHSYEPAHVTFSAPSVNYHY